MQNGNRLALPGVGDSQLWNTTQIFLSPSSCIMNLFGTKKSPKGERCEANYLFHAIVHLFVF
jgi:hypothetical protein